MAHKMMKDTAAISTVTMLSDIAGCPRSPRYTNRTNSTGAGGGGASLPPDFTKEAATNGQRPTASASTIDPVTTMGKTRWRLAARTTQAPVNSAPASSKPKKCVYIASSEHAPNPMSHFQSARPESLSRPTRQNRAAELQSRKIGYDRISMALEIRFGERAASSPQAIAAPRPHARRAASNSTIRAAPTHKIPSQRSAPSFNPNTLDHAHPIQ